MRRRVEVGLALGSLVLLSLAALAWYDAPSITGGTRQYLVEVVVLGVGVVWALLAAEERLQWGCLGALSALTVLGMWSIGPSLLPGLLMAGAASVLAAARTGTRLMPSVGWFLVGSVGQTILMLLPLWALPRPVQIEGSFPPG